MKNLIDLLIKKIYSVIVLIAANLIILAGVQFWGWDFNDIFILFWLETIIVIFFTIPKIILAKGKFQPPEKKGIIYYILYREHQSRERLSQMPKWMVIPLFIFQSAFFMFFYYIFIRLVFKLSPELLFEKFFYGLGILFLSHLFSFLFNYILNKEYLYANQVDLIEAAHSRILPIHITIVFSAWAASPVVVFVAVKTTVDLWAHLKERERFSQRSEEKEDSSKEIISSGEESFK